MKTSTLSSISNRFAKYVKHVAIMILLGLSLYSSGQKSVVDSLLNKLNSVNNDKLRAEICLHISNSYWSDNPEKCYNYAYKSLEYGKKLNDDRILFEAYKNLGTASCFKGKLYDAVQWDLLCYKKSISLHSDSLIVDALNNLAADYTGIAKYDSSNFYLNQGIKIAKHQSNNGKLCDLYVNKGNNLYYSSKVELAEQAYTEGLKIAKKGNLDLQIALLYNNIASIRLIRGLADSTVFQYINQAIRINEKNKCFRELGDNYTTLASAYSLHKNNEKTIECLRLGINTFFGIDNKVKAIPALSSLSDLYRELNQIDSASKYADLAILIGENSGDLHGLGTAYSVKGSSLAGQNKFDEAEKYLWKAYNEFDQLNAVEGILFSGNQLAAVLIKVKDMNNAKKVANHIYSLAYGTHNLLQSRNILLTLSDIYYLEKNHKKAYDYLHTAYLLTDTLNNTENKKLLDEIQTKYKSEKYQKEIEILNLREKNQAQVIRIEKNKKRLLLFSFIIGIIVVSSIIALSFIAYANKKKREKAVLNEQAAELNRLVSETDMKALRSQMNPHFIFNCVDTIERLLNDAKIQESKICLTQFSSLTRSVLENSMKREIPLVDEINTLCLYMELEKLRFKNAFTYDIKINPEIHTDITLLPPLILQPFIENSIKHGFRDTEKQGHLILEVHIEDEQLICIIEDNGGGRNKSIANTPISGFKKESMGIKLTEERLLLISKTKKIKSTFSIVDLFDELNNPTGTRVKMFLPYERLI